MSTLAHLARPALALALIVTSMAWATPDAQELLRRSDGIRNPGKPFKVQVQLTEFENGKQVDASTLLSYSREQESSGQFASLVAFMQPARDAGKLMLRNGDDLWFFDPSTKASIRLSPQQRLLGQASNGDVVTVNLAKDYNARLVGEEQITDGDRKPRKAYKLALSATSPVATYATIEYWIDADNSRPIKGLFYADSGRLLKTVFYRRFQQQLGKDRPTEMVIIDGLKPQSVTLMRFSEFTTPSIPSSWFNRDYLPRFQPE